ncbi:hypothetical protein T8T21_11210 [Limimaricola variabilis]|uniref:hypothetical protein n=1 Tax=Limimaricola variabilis TaxID=1492771 RepID=UPI002AC9199B|nr:hypothetical protein [Limimaricola variabilis]WPY93679.1 hypothetical protein T8T21_11210 [Limimaricola variabilis]
MSAATRLARLLAQERDALLTGDVAALGALIAPKQALLEELSAEPHDPAEARALVELDGALARQARLFEAAREGRERAEALRAAAGGFATYGQDGRSRPAPPAANPALSRKA